METVGFVGLGIMGRPMLKNLLKAGYTVIAFGRNAKKLDACVADGAVRAASNRDVGSRASIIFTMLPLYSIALTFQPARWDASIKSPAPHPTSSISWPIPYCFSQDTRRVVVQARKIFQSGQPDSFHAGR